MGGGGGYHFPFFKKHIVVSDIPSLKYHTYLVENSAGKADACHFIYRQYYDTCCQLFYNPEVQDTVIFWFCNGNLALALTMERMGTCTQIIQSDMSSVRPYSKLAGLEPALVHKPCNSTVPTLIKPAEKQGILGWAQFYTVWPISIKDRGCWVCLYPSCRTLNSVRIFFWRFYFLCCKLEG